MCATERELERNLHLLYIKCVSNATLFNVSNKPMRWVFFFSIIDEKKKKETWVVTKFVSII